ncbi:MAG: CoA transferase [Rhodospirillaceae bacterium]|nr:CoA transferase [Rhodospirillaceae bacterium]
MTDRQSSPPPTASTLLDGVRVVDLSRVVAGNIATHALADLGADVIKVENPETGDSLRNWTLDGIETWWKVYGRGKRSLALDLRAPEAATVLRLLFERSDILVENFRPGTLEKMGWAPERIWEANPRMVILRISGWGQEGPYAHKPGFGSLVEAYSGFAAMNGFADRPPVLPPFAMADSYAGVFGAMAVLAALRTAEKTGRGDVIDMSLLEPLFDVLGPLTLEASLSGRTIPRQGSSSPTHVPRNVYRTGDGKFVALSAGTEAMVRRLFDAMGRPELMADPRFATHGARMENRDALDAEIGAFMARHDRDACLALFDQAGVTVGPVMDALDLLSDGFMRARGVLADQPDPDLGTFPSPAPPVRTKNAPRRGLRPAPKLGEHTEEIMTELGLTPEAGSGTAR